MRLSNKDHKFRPLHKTIYSFFSEEKSSNPEQYGANTQLNLHLGELKGTEEEKSKKILSWTEEDLKIKGKSKNGKLTLSAHKAGIKALIQRYQQYVRDFEELYDHFNDNVQSLDVLTKMRTGKLQKLLYQIKSSKGKHRSKQAQSGFKEIVESVLSARIFTEFTNDPKNDAFGTGYKLWAEAFYDMWGLGEDSGKKLSLGRWKRLMLSSKDYTDKVLQLKNYMTAITQTQAQRIAKEDYNSLSILEEKINEEGNKLEDLIIVDKTGLRRWRSIYNDNEMKEIKGAREAYLRAYNNIIMKNLPEASYSKDTRDQFGKSNYEKAILEKMPIVKADQFELLKRHGLYRTIELQTFGKTPLGQVVIKDRYGATITLEQARLNIINDKKNESLKPKEAKKIWNEYKKQAEELWKRGLDAEHNALFNTTGVTVPLSGINFASKNEISEEAVSQNLSATIKKYIIELTYKNHMEKLLPMAHYLNRYYASNTNVEVRKLLQWFDDERFFKKSQESAFEKDIPGFTKGMRFLTSWTAFRYLALNWKAMMFNLSAGQTQNFVDLSPKIWIKGMSRLVKNPLKAYNIMDKMQVVNTALDVELSMPEKTKRSLQRTLFILIEVAENLNQAVPYLGLIGDKYNHYNTDGTLKKGKQGITNNEHYLALSQVQRSHGPYHPFFRRQMNLTVEGQALMQFKGWMPEMFQRYFQIAFVDEFGNIRKGVLRTLWEKESRKNIQEVLSGKRKFSELSEVDRYNLARGLRTLIMLSLFTLLIASIDEEDDEVSKNLRRALGDITYVFDLDNLTFLVEAPLPISSTIVDLLGAFKELATQKTFKRDTKRGKKGDLRGIPSIIAAGAPARSLTMSLYENYVVD